jgi:hypothetical protein
MAGHQMGEAKEEIICSPSSSVEFQRKTGQII